MKIQKLDDAKTRIEAMAKLIDLPELPISKKIVEYLLLHPKQKDLTIGSLRAALRMTRDEDNALIKAAFLLSAHPFEVLRVRYKFYDSTRSNVIQEIDHKEYMDAAQLSSFIDKEGEEVSLEEFKSRVYPYFINNAGLDHYSLLVRKGAQFKL
jgi:hypothetical protein